MPTPARFDDLESGMWLDEALDAMLDAVRASGRISAADASVRDLITRLRAVVRGPIGDDLAGALRHVARGDHHLEDLVAWVESPDPRQAFRPFARGREEARELAELDALRDFVAGRCRHAPGDDLASRWAPGLWMLEASLSGEFSSTLCPTCGVPGAKRPWRPAPGNESGLGSGHIVMCPCCHALLDVLAA